MHKEATNKKLVPALRFPEFNNAGEWKYEHGDILFDSISNKEHNSDLPILAITQEHGAIPRDEIDYNVTVTDKSVESYKVVEKGDFIISLRSFQGGIEYSEYNGICSPAYIILRKKTDSVDYFYKQYFKTRLFIADLNKNLEGIRDGKMVSYKQFSDLLLPSPYSDEQQKIADCLSSLDELIDAENQRLDALKEHKKGIMQQLFPAEGEKLPKLRFAGFNGEWEEKTIENFAPLQRGFDLPISTIIDGIYPVVFSNGILKYHNEYKAKGPGVVTGRSGTIGTLTYVEDDYWPHNTSLWVTDFKGNMPKYVYYFYQNFNIERFSTRAGVPTLNRNDVHIQKCYMPKPAEQQKIADCLSAVDEQITTQTQKIEQLKEHKKGLMQQLFPSPNE